MSTVNSDILASLFSVLLQEVVVPATFHAQTNEVQRMLEDDVSGLVDSLTDFAVTTASVNFEIETESPELTRILKKWLDNINVPYQGKIPSGIQPLAEEYFKERWKSSSFPILKIADWKQINGILVPSKMFFVEGESVYAKDKNKDGVKRLLNYDYFLGKAMKSKLDKNVIFTRPYGRWSDKYPTPFLIKRGVYHNWKIISALKNNEVKTLNQVIPYMFLIKEGSDVLARENRNYKNEDYAKIIKALETQVKALKKGKTLTRAAPWHEKIEHLIPNLENLFDGKLFAVAERNILSGLGFIDVVEATSTSRRESILNPKAFIEETKKGIKDFKQLLKEVIFLIKEKNKSNRKYNNLDFRITHDTISTFATDEFKNQIRLLWERGQLSNRTYCEVVGEVEYKTEVIRREKEAKDGIEFSMYPHIVINQEQYGTLEETEHQKLYNKKTIDKNGKPIPTDKLDDKEKYNIGKVTLIGSPYNTIKELPPAVKKKLSINKQRQWLKIFNNAYNYYLGKYNNKKTAETLAFRTAWSQIKLVKSEQDKQEE